MRYLRNQIAHEYIYEAINELVPIVLDSFNDLKINVEKTKQFVEN